MMLSMYDILELIAKGELVITPIIDFKRQVQGASIDLRLDSEFIVFKKSNITHLGLEKEKSTIKDELVGIAEEVTIGKPPERFILHPGEFALASTLEYVRMPTNIIGLLHGKSSWGRVGLLVHAVAGFVDPGYSGILTLELANIGAVPIPLYIGVPIAQLTFYKLDHPVPRYKGKYGGCRIRISKIHEYKEFEKIREIESLKVKKKNKKKLRCIKLNLTKL